MLDGHWLLPVYRHNEQQSRRWIRDVRRSHHRAVLVVQMKGGSVRPPLLVKILSFPQLMSIHISNPCACAW